MADITMYGAPWCPECKRARQSPGEQRIPYDSRDLEHNPDAAFVREKNARNQIIPTILFPDGSILVGPPNEGLAARLGLPLEATRAERLRVGRERG